MFGSEVPISVVIHAGDGHLFGRAVLGASGTGRVVEIIFNIFLKLEVLSFCKLEANNYTFPF